eukprot:UN05078
MIRLLLSSESLNICEVLLSKKDTGNEFYALNFIKRRTSNKGLYPPEFDAAAGCSKSAKHAEDCYTQRILPLLFKRFSFPILIVNPTKIPFLISKSIDITFENNFEFDFVAIVRYRSRRDFVSFREEVKRKNLGPYKTASVEKTIVYIADVDEIALITIILFTFWCSIIAVLYSVVFWIISKII